MTEALVSQFYLIAISRFPPSGAFIENLGMTMRSKVAQIFYMIYFLPPLALAL